jgi:tripeptidyl-peptidase-1
MKAACILALLACTSAAVIQSAPALSGWAVAGKTDAAKPIRVMISLKRDTSAVKRFINEASNPDSKHWLNYATKTEAESMTKSTSPKRVLSWLAAHGVTGKVTGDVVSFDAPTSTVETIFSTSVTDVVSTDNGMKWHSAGNLVAPDEVAGDVEAVFGLHGMPLPPKPEAPKKKAGQVEIPVGPLQLRNTYKVDSAARGSGNPKLRQAVAEFQGQYANKDDLATFFKQYVPFAHPGDDKVYAYKGNQGSGVGVEALLDIQYIMGVAPGVLTEFWAWRSFDFCTDVKNWTTTLLADSNPPAVHSISYGWQGPLAQLGCSQSIINSIDQDFMTLGSRGVSIIIASGDTGSALQNQQLWPSWPASSPWVTAVGATCFTDSSMKTEMASTQFGSGSGFSSMFSIDDAAFQKTHVANYVAGQGSKLPPSSYWKRYNNTYGRATADVSALGEDFEVVIRGRTAGVGGTSAATPTFAAIISLVNQKVGRPLGYLNNFIYKTPTGFTDVTKGTDAIDRSGFPFTCNGAPCGFAAAAGWDPATGLGTPLYPGLVAAGTQ